VAGGYFGEGSAVTAAEHEPGKLNAAAGALIGAAITGDGWTAERAAALAEDVPGGYLYFALLAARVAGAMLVEASGSNAQAAALVNEWVRESVRIRARKAA
jgi:hypothetical protein